MESKNQEVGNIISKIEEEAKYRNYRRSVFEIPLVINHLQIFTDPKYPHQQYLIQIYSSLIH